MSRTFRFLFTVECATDAVADTHEVERLIDLSMQDLVYDDKFIAALGESESVTIQVQPILGK